MHNELRIRMARQGRTIDTKYSPASTQFFGLYSQRRIYQNVPVFVADKFGFKVPKRSIKEIEKDLNLLRGELVRGGFRHTSEMASIRKAKGLQADAVLIVAKNIAELKKWLQTDRSCRLADKQDKCRLGYVAFTRPKEMLCIASLKELDKESIHMLSYLGIVIMDGDQ